MAEVSSKFARYKDRGQYGPGFDMYDVGVLTYEMLVGKPPFVHDPADTEMHKLMTRIARGKPAMPPGMLSDAACDLVLRLMDCDPENRPTAVEVLQHPWVVELAGATDEAEWNY